MAQLKEIVQRVYDRVRHNPDIPEDKDAIIRMANDEYDAVNDSALWLFLQTTTDLQLRKTVEGSAANTVVYSSVNRRSIAAGGGTTFRADMAGQIYVHPEDSKDYRVGNVIAGGVADGATLYLTTPIPTVGITTKAGWKLRYDRYPVPEDCSEVLGIVSRADDFGRLVFIDRKREELSYLDKDSTGDPLITIEDDWTTDRAPASAPTVAASGVSGDLLASTLYEYCYTLYYEGRESPPSPVASVTTGSGGSRRVDVSGLEDTTWDDGASLNLETRREKWLYRRDVTNRGPWQRVAKITAGATTTFTDSALVPAGSDVNASGDIAGLVPLREAGPREHLRLWFTPDTDKLVQVRYLMRPRRLAADADVPVWPTQYHRALVDLVLAAVLESHGDDAAGARARARGEKLIRQMAARHLTRTDRPLRLGRWDRRLAIRRYSNYGPVSYS